MGDRGSLVPTEEAIQNLKNDLYSLSHERVVCEVLTRSTINQCKNIAAIRKPPLTVLTARPSHAPVSSSTAARSAQTSRSNNLTDTTNKKHNNYSIPTNKTDGFIQIPSYSFQPSQQAQHPQQPTKQKPKSLSQPPMVRSTRGTNSLMVPCVRTGSLPDELRDLVNKLPVSGQPPSQTVKVIEINNNNRKTRVNPKVTADIAATQQAIEDLRHELEKELDRNSKSQLANDRKLKELAALLNNQTNELPAQFESVMTAFLAEQQRLKDLEVAKSVRIIRLPEATSKPEPLKVLSTSQPHSRGKSLTPKQAADKLSEMASSLSQPRQANNNNNNNNSKLTDPIPIQPLSSSAATTHSGAPYVIVGDANGLRWCQQPTTVDDRLRPIELARKGVIDYSYPKEVSSVVTPYSMFPYTSQQQPQQQPFESKEPIIINRSIQSEDNESDSSTTADFMRSSMDIPKHFNISTEYNNSNSSSNPIGIDGMTCYSYNEGFNVLCKHPVSHMTASTAVRIVPVTTTTTTTTTTTGMSQHQSQLQPQPQPRLQPQSVAQSQRMNDSIPAASTSGTTPSAVVAPSAASKATSTAAAGTIVSTTELFPNRNVPFVSRVFAPIEAVDRIETEAASKQMEGEESETNNNNNDWLPLVLISQQEAMKANQSLIFTLLDQQQQQQALIQRQMQLYEENLRAMQSRPIQIMPAPVIEKEPNPSMAEIATVVSSALSSFADQLQPMLHQQQQQLHQSIVATTPNPVVDTAALEEQLANEIQHRVTVGIVEGVRDALSIIGPIRAEPQPQVAPTPVAPQTTMKFVEREFVDTKFDGLLHARGVGLGHTPSVYTDANLAPVATTTGKARSSTLTVPAIDIFKEGVEREIASSKGYITHMIESKRDATSDNDDEDAYLSVSVESTDYVSTNRRFTGSRSASSAGKLRESRDSDEENWFVDRNTSKKQQLQQSGTGNLYRHRMKSSVMSQGSEGHGQHSDGEENPYDCIHHRPHPIDQQAVQQRHNIERSIAIPRPLVSMVLPCSATAVAAATIAAVAGTTGATAAILDISTLSTDEGSISSSVEGSRAALRSRYRQYEEHYANDTSVTAHVDDDDDEDGLGRFASYQQQLQETRIHHRSHLTVKQRHSDHIIISSPARGPSKSRMPIPSVGDSVSSGSGCFRERGMGREDDGDDDGSIGDDRPYKSPTRRGIHLQPHKLSPSASSASSSSVHSSTVASSQSSASIHLNQLQSAKAKRLLDECNMSFGFSEADSSADFSSQQSNTSNSANGAGSGAGIDSKYRSYYRNLMECSMISSSASSTASTDSTSSSSSCGNVIGIKKGHRIFDDNIDGGDDYDGVSKDDNSDDDESVELCIPFEQASAAVATTASSNNADGSERPSKFKLWRPSANNIVGTWK